MIVLLAHKEVAAAATKASAGLPNITSNTAINRLNKRNLSDTKEEMIDMYFPDDCEQYIAKSLSYLRLFWFGTERNLARTLTKSGCLG